MKLDLDEIAARLEEIATLLQIKGENAFKVRAYETGARALESLEEDLDTLIETGKLTEVKGIGKALAEKIVQFRETGTLPYYDELKASVPPGLLDMTEIPGFGPKKVSKVYSELGIETLDQLRKACERGELAALPGFGKKTEENILEGIRNMEAYNKRHLWWSAREPVDQILRGLREHGDVVRVEAAGSYRRGKETVGDLDFIASSGNPSSVMDWFVSQDWVEKVTAHGDTKSSVRLAGGLQADLRVVPDDRFPFALHHFTGSKEHNVLMRQRALSRGWSLSEWGIFKKEEDPEKDGRSPLERSLAVDTVKDEESLFAALGLPYIDPALREGRGEIEAGEKGELPTLVTVGDLKGVFHNHTRASDGRNSLEEMAEAASKMGWKYLGIADHSKASFQANGLDEARLEKQIEAIRELNRKTAAKRAYLFAGCEVDILRDGALDLDASVLAELDYMVISVHAAMSGQTADEMADRFIKAIEAPVDVFKMVGHLSGRLLLQREGYAINAHRVIDCAAANGAVIELNANPRRLDMDWRLWDRALDRGVLCAINPDAHRVAHLEYVETGVLNARKAGMEAGQVLNTRGLNEIKKIFGLE